MNVALTGATGFIGRYIARRLAAAGHTLRCWHRTTSDRGGFGEAASSIQWIEGDLGNADQSARLVDGCDAVVHAALYHPGGGFRGGEGDLVDFVEKNIVGTIKLIEAARRGGAGRFIFISTCAVHEKILDDRPLDERHPLWPRSHYGAHKAAIEKFVHSYGLGEGYPICALRPTGVYGVARPIESSKWYDLIRAVVRGHAIESRRGGKEVHAADVARACEVLLQVEESSVTGESFNCYDRYVSEYDVAELAREASGSSAEIRGERTSPKHQIETAKLKNLGMQFGGGRLLRETVEQLAAHAKSE